MHKDAANSISVIIPVFHGGNQFQACLESVFALTHRPLEVIVAADGAVASDIEIAKKFNTVICSLNTRQGPAAARNIGAKHACGDILFFIDADVILPSTTIETVTRLFVEKPDLAAVIGSYDDSPKAPGFLSQYRNLHHHYIHQSSPNYVSTFWGACGAIRKNLFSRMGGFDVGFNRPCVEDIDIGYRLSESGHKILLHKNLQVKHQKQWSIISMLKTDIFDRAVPWTELLLQRRRFDNQLNLRLSQRLSVLSAYGLLISLIWATVFDGVERLGVVFSMLLFILNVNIYKFFINKRGLRFTLKVIPWHWFYYIYGGFGFAVGLFRHLSQSAPVFRKKKSAVLPAKDNHVPYLQSIVHNNNLDSKTP